MRMRQLTGCILILAACALGACEGDGPKPLEPAGGEIPASNPFAPNAMRIHPLTRLERDSAGRTMIVCHVEFRDAWGDTVKALGRLAIMLYRPAEDGTAGVDTQELRWDPDLSTSEGNAKLFDPATRTYRVQIVGMPAWVESAFEAANSGVPTREVIKLRAVYEGLDASGAPMTLANDFLLKP